MQRKRRDARPETKRGAGPDSELWTAVKPWLEPVTSGWEHNWVSLDFTGPAAKSLAICHFGYSCIYVVLVLIVGIQKRLQNRFYKWLFEKSGYFTI